MTMAPPPRNRLFPLVASTLPLLAMLAGCGSGAGYPSLAKRPIEGGSGRIAGSMTVVPGPKGPEPLNLPLPADLPARLTRLESAAREAHGRFEAKRAGAAAKVSAARGSAAGSEAWSTAQVALADLESTRSDAMVALGDLDQLYAAQKVDGQNDNGGDGGAIAAVRDKVTAWVADEDAVLAELR